MQVNPYKYQLFIDNKPIFKDLATSWSEALQRADIWRDYCIFPYKKIELLNLFTGVRLPLEECHKRADAFRKLHNMQ